MATSIEVHLEACHAKGVEPSRPLQRQVQRPPLPAQHAQIAGAAAAAGKA